MYTSIFLKIRIDFQYSFILRDREYIYIYICLVVIRTNRGSKVPQRPNCVYKLKTHRTTTIDIAAAVKTQTKICEIEDRPDKSNP